MVKTLYWMIPSVWSQNKMKLIALFSQTLIKRSVTHKKICTLVNHDKRQASSMNYSWNCPTQVKSVVLEV